MIQDSGVAAQRTGRWGVIASCVLALLIGCHKKNDPREICDNGVDDDGDGQVDCADTTCVLQQVCLGPQENCTNGIDDDGDEAVDCADPNCAYLPRCTGATDGGSRDGGPADGGGSHGDGGAPCEGESCPGYCESNPECRTIANLHECCGNPHQQGDSTVTCSSAATFAQVMTDPCLVPLTPPMSVTPIPDDCLANASCDWATCTGCPLFASATCVNHRCTVVAETVGGCQTDDDCEDGQSCVFNGDSGSKECIAGAHECRTSDDCETAHPECTLCACFDLDGDLLRECECQRRTDAGIEPCPAS